MNTLISGSTDSLINVYALSQPSEDDALVDSLNTESSVEQLLWFKENGKNCLSCITHVADLQLWCLDDVKPYKHVRRSELAKEIKVYYVHNKLDMTAVIYQLLSSIFREFVFLNFSVIIRFIGFYYSGL